MARIFSHHLFETLTIENVPLDRDVYLMDEKWMPEWEAAYLELFSGKELENVGYISYAAVRKATPESLEISWYPNINDRFHEVSVVLPREAFVTCVDVYDYDEKPHIFVKTDWLEQLYRRPYSAFALIDAIGVKGAITAGRLSGQRLVALRSRIDAIADANPGIAFISFADSLLLKANWFVGSFDSGIHYSYEPESIVRLIPSISAVYKEELGMDIYAILTQGVNEYADVSLTHRSPKGSHISLNSLGLPFAQLLSIDEAARSAIRSKRHGPHELYVDDLCFHSLHFKYGFNKNAQPSSQYSAPMSSTPRRYYLTSAAIILSNLNS